jgi:hypothetical protein
MRVLHHPWVAAGSHVAAVTQWRIVCQQRCSAVRIHASVDRGFAVASAEETLSRFGRDVRLHLLPYLLIRLFSLLNQQFSRNKRKIGVNFVVRVLLFAFLPEFAV